jgi:glycosyltransferase involved in cell wall biosynthesis
MALSESEKPVNQLLPAMAFAFRFGNDDGFVQRFFASRDDLVARELRGTARCLLAFKRLGDHPAYLPEWAEQIAADFYDFSSANKQRLETIVRENRIVLIVFQGASIGEIDLGFFHGLGIRTINTEDSSFDHARTQRFTKATAKLLLRRLLKRGVHDVHIANTQGQYDFLSHFAYLPRQRLRTISYGIDTDHYRPGDRILACAQLNLDPETLWIMAAAQARPEKRVDMLINAVERVKSARPNARIGFFYVGAGQLLEKWKGLAQTLPSAADYRFFGKQSDLRPFYQAASIFIHGAFKESFGLVMAEAMASGLPVIATRAHGPAELILEGSTGYLVERDDWDAFVRAVLTYVDREDLRRSHGDMARRRCLQHYTCGREASQMAYLLRSFLR